MLASYPVIPLWIQKTVCTVLGLEFENKKTLDVRLGFWDIQVLHRQAAISCYLRRPLDQRTVERFKPLRTDAAWEGPPKGKQTRAMALTAASTHAGLSTHHWASKLVRARDSHRAHKWGDAFSMGITSTPRNSMRAYCLPRSSAEPGNACLYFNGLSFLLWSSRTTV